MDALLFSLNSILPIILLSVLGFFIKKNGTISDDFVKEGNRFCFKYAFMAMMFSSIYKIESLEKVNWNVAIFAIAVILILFVIGFFYVTFFIKDPRQKGVVHQAFYRSNYASIGLPLAFSLLGEDSLKIAAFISAFSVTLYNVLGVISLSAFQEKKEKHALLFVLKNIAKNPLIHGVLLGMICVVVRPYTGGWRLSTGNLRFIYNALDSLGQIAPWLSLVLLGGQFKFSSVKKLLPQITVSVLARLLFAPLLGMMIVLFCPQLFGLPDFAPMEVAALFTLFSAPQAVASVSMADQMNGDAELAGQILIWTALFSVLTLFVFVAIFRAYGFF